MQRCPWRQLKRLALNHRREAAVACIAPSLGNRAWKLFLSMQKKPTSAILETLLLTASIKATDWLPVRQSL